MIDVQNLTFEYPGTRALDNVSLTINKGDIMALVGPNGAGKTTLLQCMAALSKPLTGNIRIHDVDIMDDPRASHQRMGYLPDFFGLYEELTVKQCLTYMAMAHGIGDSKLEQSVNRAALRLNIDDRLNEKAGNLSRGLKQRLAIAQSIVHEPELLLLDEPASGLDPEARQELSSLFQELRNQGMTLVVSSHILSELEDYCTNMTIVREGKIIEHKILQEHEIETVTMLIRTATESAELITLLNGMEDVNNVSCQGNDIRFEFSADRHKQQQLLKSLVEKGMPVCSFTAEIQNMQDVYLSRMKTHDKESRDS